MGASWGHSRHRCRAQVRPPSLALKLTRGLKSHTYTMWFKSTLLLFLRLLLSTKKRWPAKPFFPLPGKTGHREWSITDLHTERRSERTAGGVALGRTSRSPFLERGRGLFLSEMFGFLLSPLPTAPSRVLPIPDRSVHQGTGHQHRRPSQSDALVH